MPHLERALEWVRPLVYVSNTWDYCVLWKLGDDPSSFIELVGCCCNGGGLQQMGIKKVKRKQNMSIPLCRDAFHIHPANTKACEALARLPPYLPLYPGLHGEVVISTQPKWHNIARKSDSSTLDEECLQTQVLIPILGGLIELFSRNNKDNKYRWKDYAIAVFHLKIHSSIPEDQRTIEVVKAQFAIFPEAETMSTSTISFDGHIMNPSLNQAGILLSTSTPPVAHQYSHPNFDGSSTSSFPSDEHTSPDSNPCSVSQNQQLNLCSPHQKDDATERQHCKSKNLFTERRRRDRINAGILRLRALVPKITKMNRAATLGDAVDYIEALKNQIEELKLELNDVEEDGHNKIASRLKGEIRESPNLAVQVVEGDQLGSGKLLLKIKCQQIPGAFTELLEALVSSGIHINDVTDTNVTTCNGMMWSTVTIQTKRKDIRVQDLMESLTSMTA
ncbi:LOW QUALITY PROTEIN: hypothetical protein Cgig2_018269 [Carnegiea gigantea]|uniref:BHLH domain-containing protein n=1 Tax=Carnegiea gigantea TaxID=171969 RepID=A0A9Q1QTE3_9CARY|nr:LOW QUALITY PROTEIN: hypothetical protein Cgig2_018269 [Carnegiea gigantea]